MLAPKPFDAPEFEFAGAVTVMSGKLDWSSAAQAGVAANTHRRGHGVSC
ncbi:hypothetical protein GGD83_003140 [Rhodoblastus sphagnicola]|nr:hypothetical protein [Rhodoblastus sphagnicola]MBB4199326.1 hypothetical protein [Rhodoblastus sphagnicola]